MRIRPFRGSDLDAILAIVIETFRPFFEDYVRPLLGDEIFEHQHGQWEQDYRSEVPTLHDPSAGRCMAVAEVDGKVVGLVSWKITEKPAHGEIYLLAVSMPYRRRRVGRQLCLHAIQEMKANGVEVVGIGTGEDTFHAPARALYESLGFTKIPTAAYLGRI